MGFRSGLPDPCVQICNRELHMPVYYTLSSVPDWFVGSRAARMHIIVIATGTCQLRLCNLLMSYGIFYQIFAFTVGGYHVFVGWYSRSVTNFLNFTSSYT